MAASSSWSQSAAVSPVDPQLTHHSRVALYPGPAQVSLLKSPVMLLALGREISPAGPLPGPIHNVHLPLPLCVVLRVLQAQQCCQSHTGSAVASFLTAVFFPLNSSRPNYFSSPRPAPAALRSAIMVDIRACKGKKLAQTLQAFPSVLGLTQGWEQDE